MAHTSSCRNTRIEPLKPVSTCFEEIRETEASLLFPVSRVGPPSGPFRSNESIYTVPLYPTWYSDLIQTCLIRVIFCVACNLYIAYDPKIPSRSLSLDLHIVRVIFAFSFFLAHLLVPSGIRSKFLWEIVIESPRSYKYAFVSPRETSNKLHNGQTFTRTSKEPREQRWPSTRETFHEIIYWSIKMTHGGIRWHVSVHGWPLILIPVTIRSPDAGFPRWLPTDGGAYPSASATVRLMPRSLTTIILEDLGLPISHGRYELLSSS